MKYELTLSEQIKAMEALKWMGDQEAPSEAGHYYQAAKKVAAAITARASMCEIENDASPPSPDEKH